MADTFYTDASATVNGTVIVSSWLNDVNTNTYTQLASVAGTNAITGNGASTVTVGYPRGVAFRFLPINTNTGPVTINISGLGLKNVTKYGTVPLVAGDITVGGWAFVTYDGTQFQLLNPRSLDSMTGILPVANGGTGTTGSALQGRLLNIQTFTANGTYTPTSGTTTIEVEAVGGGGQAGGSASCGAGQVSCGGGGGAGGYTKGKFAVPAPTAVTIGAGGSTGVAGANGQAGSVTSLGALITANGGAGGIAGGAAATIVGNAGAGAAASGTGGNILAGTGTPGETRVVVFSQGFGISGAGAPGPFGGGALAVTTGTVSNGTSAGAASFGAGGSGSCCIATAATGMGGGGGPGILIIHEYS